SGVCWSTICSPAIVALVSVALAAPSVVRPVSVVRPTTEVVLMDTTLKAPAGDSVTAILPLVSRNDQTMSGSIAFCHVSPLSVMELPADILPPASGRKGEVLFCTRCQTEPLELIQSPAVHVATPSTDVVPETETR